MSKKTIFEKLEIQYVEKEGLFYPSLSFETADHVEVGKFGHMWMEHVRISYPVRYRSLVRFGELQTKAAEVEECAHELLEDIERAWLREHKPKDCHSFVEMLQIREEARMIAEEMVLHDVIYQFH